MKQSYTALCTIVNETDAINKPLNVFHTLVASIVVNIVYIIKNVDPKVYCRSTYFFTEL